MEAHQVSDAILWYCLRNRRPDCSKAIDSLMDQLSSIGEEIGAVVTRDKANNLWIDARGAEPIGTMFQAHMDDVSMTGGSTRIMWDDARVISTDGKTILGADDGAGCAVLAYLMMSRVPALYLFTQGEETGARGGRHAARSEYYRVAGIERCIAFDRRGKTEICGAQWMGNLASRAFVSALSDALGLGHVWGKGSYTDNSEWQDIIPEIVNVSVGYEDEHSTSETLDYPYFDKLRRAAALVNWEALPVEGPAPDPLTTYRPGDWEELLDYPVDAEDAITEALWDICDTVGIDATDMEYSIIREALERLARKASAVVAP